MRARHTAQKSYRIRCLVTTCDSHVAELTVQQVLGFQLLSVDIEGIDTAQIGQYIFGVGGNERALCKRRSQASVEEGSDCIILPLITWYRRVIKMKNSSPGIVISEWPPRSHSFG